MLYWLRRPSPHPLEIAAERCWSGRTGLPAKQFHPKRVTGVRIPPSPPGFFHHIVNSCGRTVLPPAILYLYQIPLLRQSRNSQGKSRCHHFCFWCCHFSIIVAKPT